MNAITKTYSNGVSGFLNDSVSRTPPGNTSKVQTKNDQKLTPVVNTYSADTISQTPETNKSSDQSHPKNNETDDYSEITSGNNQVFTQAEMKLLEELNKTDRTVRQHEMAHITAGGRYITSSANFTYQRGPDGKNYAVGGEVGIDTSPVRGDPGATIQKMHQVRNAALAPADPSSQDRKVAANAISEASKALSELMISQVKDRTAVKEEKVFGSIKKAADSYERVSSMPEKKNSSFQIAV